MTWILSSHPTLTAETKQPEPIAIPAEYRALKLTKCPPTQLEQEFARKFPGRLETYQHASGILIFRQVQGATRKLHNTSTCLSASGFKLSAPEFTTDPQGRTWECYQARNAKNQLEVKTIIMDESGKSWTNVEEWFWSAFFSSPNKRYLAISEIKSLDCDWR